MSCQNCLTLQSCKGISIIQSSIMSCSSMPSHIHNIKQQCKSTPKIWLKFYCSIIHYNKSINNNDCNIVLFYNLHSLCSSDCRPFINRMPYSLSTSFNSLNKYEINNNRSQFSSQFHPSITQMPSSSSTIFHPSSISRLSSVSLLHRHDLISLSELQLLFIIIIIIRSFSSTCLLFHSNVN